jgi:hypothetical protein
MDLRLVGAGFKPALCLEMKNILRNGINVLAYCMDAINRVHTIRYAERGRTARTGEVVPLAPERSYRSHCRDAIHRVPYPPRYAECVIYIIT